MRKITQNLTAIAVTVATCFSFVPMTFAASSSYEFTMNKRAVNGNKNGIYHSLNKGAAYINGTHYEYSTDPGALGHNDIYYALYREKFGPDKFCGSICCSYNNDPSGKIGDADIKSSEYYLHAYKLEDDGHNIKGSGTISNDKP